MKINKNKSAHEAAVKHMEHGSKLDVSCYIDDDGHICAWLKFSGTLAFTYIMGLKSFEAIRAYLISGDAKAFAMDDPEAAMEKVDATTQIDYLKQMVEAGDKMDFTPIFRAYPNSISGVATYKHGTIFFRVPNTEEVMNYLIEKGKFIV